jgi:hypothetical protein
MQAAGSSHHVCAPAVRVFRPPADASAAERVDVAMRAVRRARRPRLGAQRYAPPDAMGLQADLCAALAAAAPPFELVGEPGTLARSETYRRLAVGMLVQCGDFLAGLECQPDPRAWQSVRSVRYLLHESPAARQSFLAAVQAQAVEVDDMGIRYRVPVKSSLSYLPPDQVQVVVRGLPPDWARQGVLEALLACFGYTAAGGFTVVHERAGLVSLPAGCDGVLPCLDTVVGVVATTPGDPYLRRLPGEIAGQGWVASLRVESSVADSPPVVVSTQPAPRRPGPASSWRPPASPGRMAGLFAQGARDDSMWAPTPEEILHGARPGGVRAGLGFVGGERQGGVPAGFVVGSAPPGGSARAAGVPQQAGAQPGAPTPAADAAVERQPQPAQQLQQPEQEEAAMMPAPPLPRPVPTHQPGFSAAVEHITECTDLPASDAEALVLQVRDTCPDEYAAIGEVTSPGALDAGFRRALHAAAVGMFGEDVAAPLAVPLRAAEAGAEAEGAPGQAASVEQMRAQPVRSPCTFAAVVASQPPPTPAQPAPQGAACNTGPRRRDHRPPGTWWAVNSPVAVTDPSATPAGRAAARSGRSAA